MRLTGRHTQNAGRAWATFAAAVAIVLAALLAPAPAVAQTGLLTKWGSKGSGNGQFEFPSGITTSSSGVYVVDRINYRVQRFDAIGRFQTKWGGFGSGPGQFDQPRDIAADSVGNLYVIDDHNGRIQKFDSNGRFLAAWEFGFTTTRMWKIETDPDDNVYATTGGAVDTVMKFDSDGRSVRFLSGPAGTRGTGDGQFRAPHGIATDSAGNVYVADSENYRIQKFSRQGDFLTKWGSRGSGNGQFDRPGDVATDSAGNVYVTESRNNRIQKFTSNGTFLGKWGSRGSGNGQFDFPSGIAVNPAGWIYVVDTNNHRVQVFRDGACGRALAARARAVRLFRLARRAMASAVRSYRAAQSRGDRRAASRAASQYFRARRVAVAARARYFAAGRVLRTEC